MSDDYHELGSGFNYIGEGGDSHYITGGDIAHNTLIYGNVLKYNSDDKFIIIEQNPSYEEYKDKIGFDLGSDYYSYHDFITDSTRYKRGQIREQVDKIRKFTPLYSTLKMRGTSFDNNESDMAKCGIVADSILRTNQYYQDIFRCRRNYWIINKESNTGYGPVDSLRFVQQCKRLGINLKLEACKTSMRARIVGIAIMASEGIVSI